MSYEILKQQNLNSSIFKFAAIGGFIHIAFCIAFYFFNYKFAVWNDAPFLILNIIIVILFLKKISSQLEYITFAFLFKNGFTLSLFLAVIALFFIIIYLNFIDISYPIEKLSSTRETLEIIGMNEEKIETAMEKESVRSPLFFFITAFSTKLISCSIISAIGAAIYKKEK